MAELDQVRTDTAWALRVLGRMPSADQAPRGAMQRAAFKTLDNAIAYLISRVETLEAAQRGDATGNETPRPEA